MTNSDDNYKLNETDCCICMETMDNHDDTVVLPCHDQHALHIKCAQAWLKTDLRCPLCKAYVTKSKLKDALLIEIS